MGRAVVGGGPQRYAATFSRRGALVATAGEHRNYIRDAGTILGVRASVGDAPAGQAIVVDVHKNGATIFTTQGNRPSIAAAGNTSGEVEPDVTTVAAGDFLTVDVDQAGSTSPGGELVVQVFIEAA